MSLSFKKFFIEELKGFMPMFLIGSFGLSLLLLFGFLNNTFSLNLKKAVGF